MSPRDAALLNTIVLQTKVFNAMPENGSFEGG